MRGEDAECEPSLVLVQFLNEENMMTLISAEMLFHVFSVFRLLISFLLAVCMREALQSTHTQLIHLAVLL